MTQGSRGPPENGEQEVARRDIFFPCDPREGNPVALKNGVVAHFHDGRIEKGVTHDFSPNRPSFHLTSIEGSSEGASTSVRSRDLKALFFVKDLSGDPLRVD